MGIGNQVRTARVSPGVLPSAVSWGWAPTAGKGMAKPGLGCLTDEQFKGRTTTLETQWLHEYYPWVSLSKPRKEIFLH